METLLRSLVSSSQHPVDVKRKILEKVLNSIGNSPLSSEECAKLFKLFVEWVLLAEDPMLVQAGHEQLSLLAESHMTYFHEFLSPNLIIDVFTSNIYTNKLNVVKLIAQILELLDNSDEIEVEELKRTIVNVTRPQLFGCLRDHGVNLKVAGEIARIYSANPAVLPNESDWNKLMVLVVNLLAGYHFPSSDSPSYKTDVEEFATETELVSQILPQLWGRSDSKEGITQCLNSFYVIISSEDSFNKPSSALSRIVNKFPHQYLTSATNTLMEESSQQQGETKAVVGLQTMIDWLTVEKHHPVVSEWILKILKGLHERNRNSILFEIAHSSTEKLMMSLLNLDLCFQVEHIFFFLLLGFQHSEPVFHSLVVNFPRVLKELHKQKRTRVLNRLGEAAHFLMLRFPDFPELYNPLEKKLDEIGIVQPSDTRIEELKTLSWLSPLINQAPQGLTATKRSVSKSLVDEALRSRSETGMVGLMNLGNTCYMNSVLQALYISKDFCHHVLTAPLTAHQPVLLRLQQAFAFLKYSQRSIYSPAELLKASRPPWFEIGRQQDCSEFLKYLLDTLHEQEKSGHKAKFQHSCGTSTSANSLNAVKSATVTKHVSNNRDTTDTPLEEESAKLRIASNPSLDVISEDPELAKEEAMSQGSDLRIDEDHLGSRGSLVGSVSAMEVMDGSDEEDEDPSEFRDPRGSCTSLGSSSNLKRWTTEGNLSSHDGSREGKMDLLDGSVLNNSHSNSTDSGIQSVGDSIRGSSDSMTNQQQQQPHQPNQDRSNPNAGSNSTTPTNTPTTPTPFTSLIEQVFGGTLITCYKCNTCHSTSRNKESFTDLNLAIPTSEKNTKNQVELSMQVLVNNYLKPENLEGENKYHCDKCNGLQDAVKTIKILEGPEHLICTLMRFNYDRTQNRKSKVFTDIKYNLSIHLPTETDGGCGEDIYELYAIVVHSGYSSDGGHYYTFAREPKSKQNGSSSSHSSSSNFSSSNESNQDSGQEEDDTWFIFNDSKVSFSTFQEFEGLTKRFPRDTAYLLFYRKQRDDKSLSPSRDRSKRPLRADLRMAVEKDNVQFLREKERSSSGSSGGNGKTLRNHRDFRDKDEDDDESRPNDGFGGFNAPGRLVF